MKRLATIALLTMAAALLLMSCKSVETKAEAPAPVFRSVKMMVPDAN